MFRAPQKIIEAVSFAHHRTKSYVPLRLITESLLVNSAEQLTLH